MSTESLDRHDIRSSLQPLPTLPSGRQIAYDHRRISDYNEFNSGTFDVDDEELEDGYNGEDEGKDTGVYRRMSGDGEVVDIHRGDMVDIEINGYEGQIEIEFDDDEIEDLGPIFTTEPPIELTEMHEEEGQSMHLSDNDESRGSRAVSSLRKSNRSTRSKSTNDSIEVFNFPLSNEEHDATINELLNNSYEKLGNHDTVLPKRQSNHTEEESHEFSHSEAQSLHNKEMSPLSCEETESQWPGEEHDVPRQSMQPKRPKKKLTPAKKRRRCLLAISLLIFCLGAAGAGVWFVFYYLEDKRGYNVVSEVEDTNAAKAYEDEAPIIQPIEDMFDSGCAPLTVEVQTDRFGNETSWTLVYLLDDSSNLNEVDDVYFEKRRYADGIKRKRIRRHHIERRTQKQSQELTVGTGGPYEYRDNSTQATASPYKSTYCLTKGSYKFDISDANGDGLCCKYGEGYYKLHFMRGREVHSSTFGLGREEGIMFDVTDSDIDDAQGTDTPSTSLVPSASRAPSAAPSSNMSMTSLPTIPVKSMSTAPGVDLFADVSKSYGIIFDITTHRNTSSVLIVGVDLLVHSTDYFDYEVWTMPGSWKEINTDETALHSGFEKVANGTLLGVGVCQDCGFTSIPIDDFRNVYVTGPNAVQSFMIILSSDSLVFKNNETPGSSCESFVVDKGAAMLVDSVGDLDTVLDLSDGKGFLGVIHYQSKFRDVLESDSHKPSSTETEISNSTDPASASVAPASQLNALASTSPTAFSITSTTSPVHPSPAPSSNVTFDSTILLDSEALNVNDTLFDTVISLNATSSSIAPSAVPSLSTPPSSFSPNGTTNENATNATLL